MAQFGVYDDDVVMNRGFIFDAVINMEGKNIYYTGLSHPLQ